MSHNILSSLISFAENPTNKLEKPLETSSNRASSMGDMLEFYVKRFLSKSFDIDSKKELLNKFSKVFSYTGNHYNPPHAMFRGGDAIRVFTAKTLTSKISVYAHLPWRSLESSNPDISKYCGQAEDWSVKDVLYCIGNLSEDQKSFKTLWIVDARCYISGQETYLQYLSSSADDMEVAKPIWMANHWTLKNPEEIFGGLSIRDEVVEESDFTVKLLLSREKYDKLSKNGLGDKLTEMIPLRFVEVRNPKPCNKCSEMEAVYMEIKVDKNDE